MAFSMNITREDVYPPYPAFEETIAEYVAKVDYVTSANILNGFDFDYADKEGATTKYHFSYKSDDQQNFSTQNELALLVANNTIAQLQRQLAQAVAGSSAASTLEEKADTETSTFGLGSYDIATTDTFATAWQGHAEDGSTVILNLDFNQFIKFTVTAGMHKQNTIAEGWMWKNKFRACRSDEELEDLAKTTDLDQKVVAAREIYKKLGIKPEKDY